MVMAKASKTSNPGMATKPSNTTLILSVANQAKTASNLTARNVAKD